MISSVGSIYEWVVLKKRFPLKARISAGLLNIAAVGFSLELIYWQFI